MSGTGKETIWTPKFIMVILFTFLSYAAAFLTYPLVAKFSLSLNPDLTLASTIAGLMSLASLFVCPFAGVLSDRVSRKRILQLSSVCYGAVLAMHAIPRHSVGQSRVNVGTLHAGGGRNVIPDHAFLQAEVRGETTEINAYMEQQARAACHGAAEMQGCGWMTLAVTDTPSRPWTLAGPVTAIS